MPDITVLVAESNGGVDQERYQGGGNRSERGQDEETVVAVIEPNSKKY